MDSNRGADFRLGRFGKTEPPGLPPGVLWRGRLADQLTAAVARPVTVVSAGPGWGKTMAAASWAVSGIAPYPVAWLSLDDADDNPRSFWSSLAAALVGSGAVPAGRPFPDQHLGDLPFDDADVVELCGHLADLPAPVLLVVDDFQVITHGRVLAQVAQWVADLPPTPVRLVLLSRWDPVLPLHMLRVRGDLTEIRAADLAFTAAEAATLLTGRSLHLRPEQLERVMGRTAGWPAGVQAAALTIDPEHIETGLNDFCAPDRVAAEYLVAQILNTLSAADRDFLLRTCTAEMLNGDLADHLTRRSDGGLTLEGLFAGGFFTVRRGQDGWYSYQPMVRDLLAHSAGQYGVQPP